MATTGGRQHFQEELREFLRAQGSIYDELRDSNDLTEDLESTLKQQVEKFKQGFNVEASDSLVSA